MLNGILVIDKPEGYTSHDVIARLRGILHEKRIGHGGTLDPMATGVLPVFVGRATRAAELLASADKEYTARFLTGLVTDTQDTTGNIIARSDLRPGKEDVVKVLSRFIGPQKQLPPMYSAIKRDGKKLYELARRGVEVERTPREIRIEALRLTEADEEKGEYTITLTCSKGTYVRTLCHDIGQELGCGAAMSYLRRTRAGVFSLQDAVPLEAVQAAGNEGTCEALLRSVDALFMEYPAAYVEMDGEKAARNGAPVLLPKDADLPSGADFVRVYGPDGIFLMLGRAERSKDSWKIKTVKSFFQP